MNSYIWRSLETLKEVEITKEGLVIHHFPDMCPYRTATIQKNSHEQTETHRGGWEEAPDFGSYIKTLTARTHARLCRKGAEGKVWDRQLGSEGTWFISPIIQSLFAPHIPLHRSLSHSLSTLCPRGATFPPAPD